MNASCNWVDLFRSGQFSSCRHTVDKPLASHARRDCTLLYSATASCFSYVQFTLPDATGSSFRRVGRCELSITISHLISSFLVVGQLGQNSSKTTAINVQRNFRLIFSAFVRLCDYRRMLPFRDSRFLRGPTITFSDGDR